MFSCTVLAFNVCLATGIFNLVLSIENTLAGQSWLTAHILVRARKYVIRVLPSISRLMYVNLISSGVLVPTVTREN